MVPEGSGKAVGRDDRRARGARAKAAKKCITNGIFREMGCRAARTVSIPRPVFYAPSPVQRSEDQRRRSSGRLRGGATTRSAISKTPESIRHSIVAARSVQFWSFRAAAAAHQRQRGMVLAQAPAIRLQPIDVTGQHP